MVCRCQVDSPAKSPNGVPEKGENDVFLREPISHPRPSRSAILRKAGRGFLTKLITDSCGQPIQRMPQSRTVIGMLRNRKTRR